MARSVSKALLSTLIATLLAGLGVLLTGCAEVRAQSARSAASGPSAGPPVGKGLEGTLLVLGDSLSAEYGLTRGTGWVALLSQRLQSRRIPLEVVNASISGETTSGGVSRIASLLQRHRPAVVVIELGGNDALRGLPLSATEANLRQMASAARQSGARTLIVGMKMPPNYGRAYAQAFAEMFAKVATAEKAGLVPFMLESIGEKIEYFQPDRIHPTEQAQPLILDTVWPELARLIGVPR